MSFYMILNNKTNNDIGVDIIKRPSIPAPKEKVKVIEIDGRENLYVKTGIYEDITFTIDFNYSSEKNFNQVWRNFKKWLLKLEDNKLIFSDDLDYFYKVNDIEIFENARQELYEFGSTTVNITVNPYMYEINGLDSVLNPSSIYNQGCLSKPLYRIKGEGNITIKVNGVDILINIGQEAVINTDLQQCFKADQLINLVIRQGSFEDLYLQEGNNTFVYTVATGGRIDSIEIIPNYRTL